MKKLKINKSCFKYKVNINKTLIKNLRKYHTKHTIM